MRKTVFLGIFTFLLCMGKAGHAQPAPAPFAYGYAPGGKAAAGKVSIEDYRYQIIDSVLERLIDARGDRRLPAPKLVFNKGEKYVAWMDAESATIGLEAKAYEVCTSFGKDSLSALSMLLAHELTHYYEKHDWTRHFAQDNEGLEATQQIEALDERLKQEAQADQLGMFLALSAGFGPLALAPELLERIYDSYGLPAASDGYPEFSERQEIARQAREKVRRLSDVFHTASCLLAVGQYADASYYYDFLLRHFQSRELYNNSGVAKVLAALRLFDDEEQPLGYPVELDIETRLATQSRDPKASPQELREGLLRSAIDDFEQAAALDSNYPIALLNRACAHTMLAEYEDARYFLSRAERLATAPAKTRSDIDVLRGILAYFDGDQEAALEYSGLAADRGNALGAANRRRLEGQPAARVETVRNLVGVERIDSLLLDRYVGELLIDEQQSVGEEIVCASRQLDHSRILVNFIGNGYRVAVFHMTGEAYPGKTAQGLGIGASVDDVFTVYGQPQSTFELAQGRMLVYPRQKLIFRVDRAGKLAGWIIYRQ